MARKEGLPTTPAELAATIPVPRPEENAAPFYALAIKLRPELKSEVSGARHFESPERKLEVERALAKNFDFLKLIDQGSQRRHCWFNRNWAAGFALPHDDEYSTLRVGSNLKLMRGSLAASAGDSRTAILEAGDVSHMAEQLREEPDMLMYFVSFNLDRKAISALENWAIYYPSQKSAYLGAAQALLQRQPELDLKAVHRTDLVFWLKLLEDSKTPDGLKAYGGAQDYLRVPSFYEPYEQAKVDLVHAWRDYWRGLKASGKQRDKLCALAMERVAKASCASPWLNAVYQELAEGETSPSQILNMERARKLVQAMALHALSLPEIPRSWPDSLPSSPLDGRPVRYTFDGKLLKIDAGVEGEDGPSALVKISLPSTSSDKPAKPVEGNSKAGLPI